MLSPIKLRCGGSGSRVHQPLHLFFAYHYIPLSPMNSSNLFDTIGRFGLCTHELEGVHVSRKDSKPLLVVCCEVGHLNVWRQSRDFLVDPIHCGELCMFSQRDAAKEEGRSEVQRVTVFGAWRSRRKKVDSPLVPHGMRGADRRHLLRLTLNAGTCDKD